MNNAFLYLGIFVVLVSFAILAIHPYQRGGAHARGTGIRGPVWLILFLVGIGIIGYAIYLPS